MTVSNFRRVPVQGIHLSRLVYLSEREFKLLSFLRLDFLKRRGNFYEEPSRIPQSGTKKETLIRLRRTSREDLKSQSHTPCYEPTDISFTRDSLFWRWRRVKENKIEHGRIPPRCSYLQGDVEAFHRIVVDKSFTTATPGFAPHREDELYEVESYDSPIEFLDKAYAYANSAP